MSQFLHAVDGEGNGPGTVLAAPGPILERGKKSAGTENHNAEYTGAGVSPQ